MTEEIIETPKIVEEITVHAYDWKIRDKYDEKERVNIHAWCLDRDSKPYLLRFNDFPAICRGGNIRRNICCRTKVR